MRFDLPEFDLPEPDELPGFVKQALPLREEDDGPLWGTLVYAEGELERDPARGTVLYLHGFVDYFFQTHLKEAFSEAGYRFFALDLRRYGRSLHPDNRPNYARQIDEYFEEITAALEFCDNSGPLCLMGHSTGGLIASVYTARGPARGRISRLILNSPFFRFPARGLLALKLRAARQIGRVLPRQELPQKLNPVYGMTIHRSEQGEWDYDLSKKPLGGFPFYGGWIDMILSAQEEVERGLNLELPILSLHSDSSRVAGTRPQPEDFRADTVLRVEDIAELSSRLGSHVQVEPIPGGLHDLTLSAEPVRSQALSRMVAFLDSAPSPSSGEAPSSPPPPAR